MALLDELIDRFACFFFERRGKHRNEKSIKHGSD